MELDDVPAGTVVVGVDGSDSSREALQWAIEEARVESLPLVVAHAVGPIGAVWIGQDGTDTRTGEADSTPLLDQERRVLDEACDEARRTAPGLEVHDVLRVADPRDVLIALAERAAVLVVGSRGRGPVRSLLLGSVSMAVVRHSTCPVVVIRPRARPVEDDGILVGIDGSDRSSQILRFAYQQASRRGLSLVLLHTYLLSRPPTSTPTAADPPRSSVETLTTTDPEEVERSVPMADVLKVMQKEYPDVVVQRELTYGLPGEVLLQRSAGMSMVVVGASAGGAASGLLFGSIAAFVVEHASCPVAVVPVGAT